MTATITVEARVLGHRAPLLADGVLVLPPEWAQGGTCVLLEDLIARTVRQEVAAFRERQARQRLLHVLAAWEIEARAARGKVAMGGRDLDQEVDPEAAVERALQAFRDGLYYVFVDGAQLTSLDAPVQLGPDSRVTFLRLIALAGG